MAILANGIGTSGMVLKVNRKDGLVNIHTVLYMYITYYLDTKCFCDYGGTGLPMI